MDEEVTATTGTLALPPGKRMAVALTFDFDAHSPWMGTLGRTSPSYLSRGDSGAEQGVPRLLELLGRRGLRRPGPPPATTWSRSRTGSRR